MPDDGAAVADDAGGAVSSAVSALTDDHLDWAHSFCGVDPRAADAGAATGAAATGAAATVAAAAATDAAPAADSGGLLGAIASGIGDVAGAVAGGVADVASAGLNAAGSVAGAVVGGVADVASAGLDAAGNVADAVASNVGPIASAGLDAAGSVAGAISSGAGSVLAGAEAVGEVANDFTKGVGEGLWAGVKGLATSAVHGAEAVGSEAYDLATSADARQQALDTVQSGAEAVGNFAETAVTDPGQAAGEVGDAVESGAKGVAHAAEGAYDAYEQAAASGHGAEFLGKAVGEGTVLVAGAVLTDGASAAAEGALAVGEGATLLGEGTAVVSELAADGATLTEGAEAAGQTAAITEDAADADAALGEADELPQTAASDLEQAPDTGAQAADEGIVDIGEDPELQDAAREADVARPDLDAEDDTPPIERRDVSTRQARREATSDNPGVREAQGMTDPNVQAGHTQAVRNTAESGAPREQVNNPDTYQHLHSRRGQGLDVDVTDQEGLTKTTTRHRAQEGIIDDAVDRSRVDGALTPEGQQAAGDEVLWRTDGTGLDQREVQMKRNSGLFDEQSAIDRSPAVQARRAGLADPGAATEEAAEAPRLRVDTEADPNAGPRVRIDTGEPGAEDEPEDEMQDEPPPAARMRLPQP